MLLNVLHSMRTLLTSSYLRGLGTLASLKRMEQPCPRLKTKTMSCRNRRFVTYFLLLIILFFVFIFCIYFCFIKSLYFRCLFDYIYINYEHVEFIQFKPQQCGCTTKQRRRRPRTYNCNKSWEYREQRSSFVDFEGYILVRSSHTF